MSLWHYIMKGKLGDLFKPRTEVDKEQWHKDIKEKYRVATEKREKWWKEREEGKYD